MKTVLSRALVSVVALELLWSPTSLAAARAVGPADVETSQPTPRCLALVLPSVRGADGDATAMAQSLRELFISYLSGPSLRPLSLEARLESQAITEARQKECGYALIVTLTRTRDDGGALGRALGQAAAGAAWRVPYGSNSATAAARGAAIEGAYIIRGMAQTTRAKDELRLEYRVASLEAVAQAQVRRETLKAKSDGDDVLTPLVERVAEAVASAMPQ